MHKFSVHLFEMKKVECLLCQTSMEFEQAFLPEHVSNVNGPNKVSTRIEYHPNEKNYIFEEK